MRLYLLSSLAAAAAALWCKSAGLDIQAMAFARMFPYLFLGGGGMCMLLSRRLAWAKASEYYRVFQWLYHVGVLLMAMTSFWGEMSLSVQEPLADIRLAAIIGWTLFGAGLIVLLLIIRDGPESAGKGRQ